LLRVTQFSLVTIKGGAPGTTPCFSTLETPLILCERESKREIKLMRHFLRVI